MIDSTEADAVPGQPARLAALALIHAGLNQRAGLEEAMWRPPFTTLTPRERAFAMGLAQTTLRRLGSIDRLLDARLQKAPPDAVRALLRIGVAQALYRDTPAFAAVASTVELAQADPDARAMKGLVNAVLRRIVEAGAPDLPPEADLPDWLWQRWRAAYGEDAALKIAAMAIEEPATDLTLRDPSDAAALAPDLEAEALAGGSLRTRRRGELGAWPGFAEGRWWVQDAAAAVPARLLNVEPGESALDLCAAPGGKTLQLAAAGAHVTALDRSARRLERLSANLARTGLTAEVVATPAERWADPRTFDAVLLDAPCTATGTFRRHPDVLWVARPSDIAKLAEVQSRLLDVAARRVRPGGRLVYCVCSLEPEEGEAQIAAFLTRHPRFRLDPVADGEGGAPPGSVTPSGGLRILPFMDGGRDGFYAARAVAASA